MVSHHLAMFGDHWFSASGDMKYLICHMISQNHVIERASNFMSGSHYYFHGMSPACQV